jgi:hypothetical protein
MVVVVGPVQKAQLGTSRQHSCATPNFGLFVDNAVFSREISNLRCRVPLREKLRWVVLRVRLSKFVFQSIRAFLQRSEFFSQSQVSVPLVNPICGP